MPNAEPAFGIVISRQAMIDWSSAESLARQLAAAWRGGPGGAFVLFDTEGVRATACGGVASLEHDLPFTAETPSRYASISKHILAVNLLLEGIDLEAKLGVLVPGLPDAFAAVPLARALDMTGGLPDMMEVLWQLGVPFTATISADGVRAMLQLLRATCAPPGVEMAYSNTGWRLGQAVLEHRTEAPYAELLRDRLFRPLDLAMWFPGDEAEPVPGLATGYWMGADGWQRGRYGMHMSASGGIAGTAAALARWAGVLMAGRGELGGILDRLAAPRTFASGTLSNYRLGLVELSIAGTRLLAHGGSLPGYRNHLLMAPELGVGVVLLMNHDADPLLPALLVFSALLGIAPVEPAPDRPTGLFAAAEGPAWTEMHPGAIEFMGARETLCAAGDRFQSIPSTLAIDVAISAEAIEGTIGGVARHLRRVPAGLGLDPALTGSWREETFGTELSIAADGTARCPWMGPLGQAVKLTPLPGARAIAELSHLMWRHRPCLWLDGEGTLRIASHRARVLRYQRV